MQPVHSDMSVIASLKVLLYYWLLSLDLDIILALHEVIHCLLIPGACFVLFHIVPVVWMSLHLWMDNRYSLKTSYYFLLYRHYLESFYCTSAL